MQAQLLCGAAGHGWLPGHQGAAAGPRRSLRQGRPTLHLVVRADVSPAQLLGVGCGVATYTMLAGSLLQSVGQALARKWLPQLAPEAGLEGRLARLEKRQQRQQYQHRMDRHAMAKAVKDMRTTVDELTATVARLGGSPPQAGALPRQEPEEDAL